jgi:hypothetical protein
MVKPKGGLWGSPIGCRFGWKEWCKSSKYKECSDENSFHFKLTEDANILTICSVNDLDDLPKAESPFSCISSWILLDFENLMKNGVDAIQVNMSDDRNTDIINRLYFRLYGWDCDSILVMNKEVIIA